MGLIGQPYALYMVYDRDQRAYYAEVRFPQFTEFFLGHDALLPPKHVASADLRNAHTRAGASLGGPLDPIAQRYGTANYEYMCHMNAAEFSMPYPREHDTISFFETQSITFQIVTIEFQ
jgi:hypothetical protein